MVISKQKKRTQVALGKIIGTYGDVIGRYERGDITPSVDVVAKIADALEVSVDYLIYKTKLLIDKNILNRLEEFSNLLRIKNLKYSAAETKRVRSVAAHQRSIKITININAQTLAELRAIANETGIPYQRLINRTLSESLATKTATKSRLDDIEKQLKAIQKKLAA